ncbi:MAG: CvpA family protein, partial [Planctomycetia bacterium]
MPAIVMDLFVLVGLLYCGFLGLSRGFYEAAVAGLEVLGALVLAVLSHEFLAAILGRIIGDVFGPFLPASLSIQAWSVFIVFALVFWGTLAALVRFVHPLLRADEVLPETLVDRLGGAFTGAYAGSLFIGAILVTWSMCPLLSGLLPIPARRMNFDVGRFALRAAGRFATEWRTENPSGVLDGEPVSPQKTRTACTESWRDLDENGSCEESDQYHDADNNQQFTKVLYYTDLDGDGGRRIGLVDKYVVGVWDIGLRSDRAEEP